MIYPMGPCPARIMIVSEFPNEMEALKEAPLVGAGGQELSKMLNEVGIMRGACFVTCFLRTRPPGNDIESFISNLKNAPSEQHGLIRDKWCLPPVWEGLDLLKREIELCRPNVIIAVGNGALWALTGNWGIMSWRGSMLQTDLTLALDYKPKVLPIYNPNMVLAQWSWRPVVVHDLKRAVGMSKTKELILPDYRFITRPDYSTAAGVLLDLLTIVRKRKFKLSVDIETRAGHIACIGIAWSKLDSICIPLMCSERLDGYWKPVEEAWLMYWMYKLLTHPNAEVIGQNFLYDSQYFNRHLHYTPRLVRDTMLAQHVCFSNLQKSLDYLSSMYCDFHRYWKDDGKNWDAHTGEDQLWRYNCTDAVVTYEVDDAQVDLVESMKLTSVNAFQQRLFWPVLKTMNKGLRVDERRRAEFAGELFEEIAKRDQKLLDLLGFPVNIKSPKQMQELFYVVLGQKPILNRKTRQVTCDDEALGKLYDREPLLRPIIRLIQELRSLGVFLSTFVNAALDIDRRVRCSFNIAGAETYRFSSSKNAFGSGLNLQNIPSGGDEEGLELPNIRTLYIPDPGHTFWDIDLGSADLRIVVWESDEIEMKAMLREGMDPYTEIAKEFYHDPTITKKDPRRQTFKSFAHGTHYLGTAKGLAERLGLSVHDAEKTQKWYFQRFPRIKKWQDNLIDQVTKRRMVQNIFGYRQYFFDRIEGTIFNQAAAWIPQSTVACLINRAYVAIDEQVPETDILLQVHDSLAGQYPTHLEAELLPRILKCAEIVLPYDDPLIIPVGVKKSTRSWGHCE